MFVIKLAQCLAEKLFSNCKKYCHYSLSWVCQNHKPRGVNSSPSPKQVRQWQKVTYLHLPAPGQALSGLKESREFLRGQKDLEKPALDLSCLCWQKIRLILKQIYGFGFSPGLTGTSPDHDFRTHPGQQWAAWVILRNTLASCELPNQNAWELGQTPSGLFRSCWGIGFEPEPIPRWEVRKGSPKH